MPVLAQGRALHGERGGGPSTGLDEEGVFIEGGYQRSKRIDRKAISRLERERGVWDIPHQSRDCDAHRQTCFLDERGGRKGV